MVPTNQGAIDMNDDKDIHDVTLMGLTLTVALVLVILL